MIMLDLERPMGTQRLDSEKSAKWERMDKRHETQSRRIKADIKSIRQKAIIARAIVNAVETKGNFLIIGHVSPDEDCVSSMVAFALLVRKFGKRASIMLGASAGDHFEYLLRICTFNEIQVAREDLVPDCDALVLVDTPKPSMIDRQWLFDDLRNDPRVLKIELDHHLGADSEYFTDVEFSLVFEASSTCETIGYLALKMNEDRDLLTRWQVDELLSRNLVLAILSGMIADSQMGRFLKTERERWFYRRFSALFETMLASKTRIGSGNFSSKEQVFEALLALSREEDSCYRELASRVSRGDLLHYAVLDSERSRNLFARYGNDTVITVSKALVDHLAAESGYLGLVAYYDDPSVSQWVQFRLRRSQSFAGIDLRDSLARLGVQNGGGHPGAVGFRIGREDVADMDEKAREYALILEEMVARAMGETRDR